MSRRTFLGVPSAAPADAGSDRLLTFAIPASEAMSVIRDLGRGRLAYVADSSRWVHVWDFAAQRENIALTAAMRVAAEKLAPADLAAARAAYSEALSWD